MYAFCVCVGGLERKTVSKLFALFIALPLPSLDIWGYPFNSGQKKKPFTRYTMRMTEIRNLLNTKKRKQKSILT